MQHQQVTATVVHSDGTQGVLSLRCAQGLNPREQALAEALRRGDVREVLTVKADEADEDLLYHDLLEQVDANTGHDLPTNSIHVNHKLGNLLLSQAGIKQERNQRWGAGRPIAIKYVKADGGYLWDRGEAIHHALAIIATKGMGGRS